MALQKQQLAQEQSQWLKEFNAKYGSSSSLSTSSKSSSSTKLTNSKSSSSSGSTSLKSNSSSNSSSETIKLSNGKTGYSNAVQAYIKAGGTTPYSAKGLISKGLVKSYNYKGTTYYYVP